MRMNGIAGCFFYLLYSAAVLAFMLWLQFPAEAVRNRAEGDLNQLTPGLRWRISAAGLSAPADLRFSGITVSAQGGKEALLNMDSFSLRPDLMTWVQGGGLAAQYSLRLPEGTLSGRLSLNEERSALRSTGEAAGIRLDSPALKPLLQDYGRAVSGTLSASFTVQQGEGRQAAAAEGDFRVAKGAVSLQQPVLGLKQIAFDSLRVKLKRQDGLLRIEGGKLESALFSAEFSGTLRLEHTLPLSHIQLTGSFAPRPEFMAALGSPVLADLLKRQLRQGKLSFTISGMLQEPGINFIGLPAEFNRQIQDTSHPLQGRGLPQNRGGQP
jgi:type II secretion system protein N